MPQSFSISRNMLSRSSPEALQDEIQLLTGNEAAASSVMRSLERFGRDESIRYFEMEPRPGVGTRQSSDPIWTVRAIR